MNILMTGSSGFIGSHVLGKLRGHNVILLTSTEIKGYKCIKANGYNFNTAYLLENGCEDVNVVIHLGAFTPKTVSEADRIGLSTSNITNTLRLIDALKNFENLKKFIFISTIDVYSETDEILTELTSTIPVTMYGWSKLYCEQMVKKFAEQKGIQYEILRLGHVYGEGEEKYRKVMPVMIKNAIIGDDITIFGDGEALRTFIYIDDVAEAIVNSIDYGKSDTINIVGSKPVSLNDLAALIANLSGKDICIKHISTTISNRNLCFDNKKLINTLLTNLIPLEIGLKKEMDYMKKKL